MALMVILGLAASACGGADTASPVSPTATPVADTPTDAAVEAGDTTVESAEPDPVEASVATETEPDETAEPVEEPAEVSGATAGLAPAGAAGCGEPNPPIQTMPVDNPIATNRGAELGFVQWFDVPISEEYELSGLALANDGAALWTVSDVSSVVLRIGLDGAIQCELPAPSDDLEGIAIDPTGQFLYIAHEAEAEIFKVDIVTGEVLASARLPEMENYAPSAKEVEHGGDNKSIEGIAFAKGDIFLLKEGDPGLIMRVSEDLSTFHGYRSLHGRLPVPLGRQPGVRRPGDPLCARVGLRHRREG